ncbi:AAA family ATPase [Aeromicrobium sp.]|uniref:AAA family ATPase n=1 Tax=Aeromicrobium sp. TaxID=1871063 RepID=UPI003FA5C1EC
MISGLPNPAETDPAALELRTAQLVVDKKAHRAADLVIAAESERGVDFDTLYLDREALKNLPEQGFLIPGVLPRHTYGLLRGRDQSFKSFVALDWALTIATGRFWGPDPTERSLCPTSTTSSAWPTPPCTP